VFKIEVELRSTRGPVIDQIG